MVDSSGKSDAKMAGRDLQGELLAGRGMYCGHRLTGCLSGFFEPARSAIIPSLVPKKDLVTANALSGSTWSVMLAFGAALGGVIVYLFGIKVAFILDAGTFILSAWFLSKIPSQKKSTKK